MYDALIELAVRIYAAKFPHVTEDMVRSLLAHTVNNRTDVPPGLLMHARHALQQVGFRSRYLITRSLDRVLVYLPVGDEFHMHVGGVWCRTTVNPERVFTLARLNLQPIEETGDA